MKAKLEKKEDKDFSYHFIELSFKTNPNFFKTMDMKYKDYTYAFKCGNCGEELELEFDDFEDEYIHPYWQVLSNVDRGRLRRRYLKDKRLLAKHGMLYCCQCFGEVTDLEL